MFWQPPGIICRATTVFSEHTREVLREAGCSEPDIERLSDRNVVRALSASSPDM